MDPVLLFGLVALAGGTVLLNIFRDEADFAEDDPDDAGEGPGGPDAMTPQNRQNACDAKVASSKDEGRREPGSAPDGR